MRIDVSGKFCNEAPNGLSSVYECDSQFVGNIDLGGETIMQVNTDGD